jgi:hypothetical protein
MLTSLCIFCATAGEALHGFIGRPGGLLGALALLAYYLLPASIAMWVQADAQARGSRMPYDFDSLVFVFWPVVAPVYLFRTRGWRAFGPIAIFFVLQFAGVLFAVLLGYPRSMESFAP